MVPTIRFEGDLDAMTLDDVRAELEAVPPETPFTVDLGDVTFIDVRTYITLKNHPNAKIQNLRPSLKRLFRAIDNPLRSV